MSSLLCYNKDCMNRYESEFDSLRLFCGGESFLFSFRPFFREGPFVSA